MIVLRAVQANIITKLGCHTFRATGITVYLLNAGLLEYAQQMAAQESARRTKLYDRRNIVERTIGWLGRCRWLAKDWEKWNHNALLSSASHPFTSCSENSVNLHEVFGRTLKS